MKKTVLKVDLHDDKAKQKALRVVSSLPGIDAISMDMKERKLTVIGTADPVDITSKLRKYWPTAAIILVGPAKEPEKKEEPKKDEGGGGGGKKDEEKKEEEKKDGGGGEGKKEEGKKDEGKKEEGAKKDDGKGDDAKKPAPAPVLALPQPILHHPHHIDPRFYHHYEMMRPYRPYPPPPMTAYYHAPPSMEDNPNALCTIS